MLAVALAGLAQLEGVTASYGAGRDVGKKARVPDDEGNNGERSGGGQ